MARKLMSDMRPKQPARRQDAPEQPKRKIWDTESEPTPVKRKPAPQPRKVRRPRPEPVEDYSEMRTPDGGHHKNHKTLWLIALVSILVLFFAVSSNFSSAKVSITPKSEPLDVSELLSATRGGGEGDSIPFEIVSMDGSESTTIQGSEQKDLKLPARGQVTIYNKYSSASQKLSIDTRLEGSNGKIYKTDKEITVPGMDGDTPGSVDVGVYGYEPGEDYNSGPLDFKIVGFRGTSKYDKFFARSQGDITGGLSGKFFVVSEEEKSKVSAGLGLTLKDKLTKKVMEQVPPGYILFSNAMFFTETSSNVGTALRDEVTPVSVNGSVFGYLFKEEDLVARLAKMNVKGYDGSPAFIPELSKFNFIFGNKEGLTKDTKNFNFKISGKGNLVYKVSEDQIAEQLLGRQKSDFKNVLANNPNIDSAELVLRPLWRSKLPDKLKKIKIIINYPEVE